MEGAYLNYASTAHNLAVTAASCGEHNYIAPESYSSRMDKLADVSADALRAALGDVESAKAAKRLMVALDYKHSVSVDVLTERYGIPRSTLYYWLDRFEEGSIEDAIEDEPRPGRPPRLTETARETLQEDLADDPADHGYDADAWTPELVQSHVEREYGVSYSTGHVRRLLREFDTSA